MLFWLVCGAAGGLLWSAVIVSVAATTAAMFNMELIVEAVLVVVTEWFCVCVGELKDGRGTEYVGRTKTASQIKP